MKKLLLLSFIIFSISSAFAQVTPIVTAKMTNATVAAAVITLGTGVGGKAAFTISVDKVSGTVGGGVAFQSSNDGIKWINMVYTGIAATDTLALTNVAYQSRDYLIDIPPTKFIRARGTGTGTMVATLKLIPNYRYNSKP